MNCHGCGEFNNNCHPEYFLNLYIILILDILYTIVVYFQPTLKFERKYNKRQYIFVQLKTKQKFHFHSPTERDLTSDQYHCPYFSVESTGT